MTGSDLAERPARASVALAPWIRIAVLIVLALAVLWFAIRAMLLGALEREYPALGAAMQPPSAISQAIIALNRAAARDGVADPLARTFMKNALRRAPLLADPFIVAGLDASARDDLDRAERLMEEARRRDPRSVIPRYWLFDNYLREGNYAQGIAEAQPLIRLQPAAAPATVAVLTALVDVPAARPALLAALRNRPSWRRSFFAQAAAAPRLRRQAVALLLAATPEGAAWAGREHSALMRELVRGGEFGEAYSLWLRTLPPHQRPAAPGLHDGNFKGRPGGPPFGWRLPEANRGAVQIVEAGDAPSGSGLAIRAEGDRDIVLAEQLVLAKPGPLRLSFAARALEDAPVSEAGLRSELHCAATGRPIAGAAIAQFGPRLEKHSLQAVLPPGCGAVLVRFSSVPGMEPGPLSVLLTSIALLSR